MEHGLSGAETDVRGDLHSHGNLTDGQASLADMVTAAARGYEYYAITDRAPNLVMQRMTHEKMLAQREQVRQLADAMAAAADGTVGNCSAGNGGPMTLLLGTELNIAPDGDGVGAAMCSRSAARPKCSCHLPAQHRLATARLPHLDCHGRRGATLRLTGEGHWLVPSGSYPPEMPSERS